MAAAGYDVGAGDTWALNELSSAVRQGTGNARANMRAFLNGLYDGDGTLAGGARRRLHRRDRPGDQRSLALPGAAPGLVRGRGLLERRRPLRRRLVAGGLRRRAPLRRSRREPGGAARPAERVPPAPGRARRSRSRLRRRRAGVPRDGVQPARERRLAVRRRLRLDGRRGRADAGLRLGPDLRAALRPGTAASASPGRRRTSPVSRRPSSTPRRTRCSSGSRPRSPTRARRRRRPAARTGAPATSTAQPRRRPGGRSSAWKPSRLAFTSSEQTLAPGVSSAPLTVELQTSTGIAYTAGVPVTVELTSSSPTAELAASPSGPWAPTLAAPIASGASTTTFYVRDPSAGSVTITAAAAGKSTATQTVAVGPAAPTPPSSSGGSAGPAPDLVVQASALPAAPAVGDTITYVVSVRNLGGQASRVSLAVQLPPQATFTSSQSDRGAGCTGAATLACELDFLAGDLVATVRITAVVREAGTLRLTAVSAAQPADAQPANDTAAVTTVVATPAAITAPARAAATLRTVGATRDARQGNRDGLRPLLDQRPGAARSPPDTASLDSSADAARGDDARRRTRAEGAPGPRLRRSRAPRRISSRHGSARRSWSAAARTSSG